ncbi:MAG TPA: methyltransferase domain-containing protein [Nonomuraea sp.]|nr:methyltransferase domain-containing protein [Nonomuraea sp.]
MTSFSRRYLERDRAESFGSLALQYDRFRPSFPEALIDRLAAVRPADVLDVGCGTGKVAAALRRRGIEVLGVELDPRMAEVARGKGITVEVAGFEDWDDAGRRFDLIVSGDAWHWIDPAKGMRRATELLRSGGTIARFWSFHELDAQVLRAFEPVYREHAPGAHMGGNIPKSTEEAVDPFAGNDAFTAVESMAYHWELTLTSDEWVGLVSTFSDHLRLADADRDALLRGLHQVIEGLGGAVRTKSTTFVQTARRA